MTETPTVGTVEDWVYINLTGDTHPMHTHLVTFQVVGRTPFDVEAYEAAYGGPHGVPGGIDPTPFATGPMEPPDPDRARLQGHRQGQPRLLHHHPGQVRPADRRDRAADYVYHCHIVEHEDNDMMRPFTVAP